MGRVDGGLTPTLIRPAVAADQTAITSMVRDARINPRNLHWNNFLVALEDDRIVGARQVKIHRAGTREVASGVVLPEYRRKGNQHQVDGRHTRPRT